MTRLAGRRVLVVGAGTRPSPEDDALEACDEPELFRERARVSAGHFEQPIIVPQMSFSAPRLYLAAGVTTMRTTGSVEPYTDLALKREIDAGKLVGPGGERPQCQLPEVGGHRRRLRHPLPSA